MVQCHAWGFSIEIKVQRNIISYSQSPSSGLTNPPTPQQSGDFPEILEICFFTRLIIYYSRTLADEALFYFTIYPNSRYLGTVE